MAETEKKLTKIPLSFVAANNVKALSDRPNQAAMFGGKGGMSAGQLKAAFDIIMEALVDRVNSIIEIITSKNNGDTVSVESLASSSEIISLNEFVRAIKSGEFLNYILLKKDESITGKSVSLSSEISARLVAIQLLIEGLENLQKETSEAVAKTNADVTRMGKTLSGVDATLFQEIDELRKGMQEGGVQEGGAQEGGTQSGTSISIKGLLADAVVVNGEVRLPSDGLVYELSEDGLSYKVAGIGTCTDIDIVIPRTYDGLPITAIGDNAFENAQIDSINLWETVTSIGKEAFKGCAPFRFIYIYSTTPIVVGEGAFPDTVQGYFVPLHNVEDYKTDEGWTNYKDKVVAIETAESINTAIVNVYKALSANDENLGRLIQNLSASDTALQQCIENLGGVDAYLLSLITELQGYSQGLEYIVVEVDGVLGFGVSGIGTCTDTDIVIPPTYNDFPVLVISENAFSGNESITSVVIPESVIQVKSGAFLECSNLTSVKFLGEIPPFIAGQVPAGLPPTYFPFSDTVEEFLVPASSAVTYEERLHKSYASYAANVVAIETLETLRTDTDALRADIDSKQVQIDNLQGQIDDLKPRYSEGLEYLFIEVDGVKGYKVTGNGTCLDVNVIIPPTHLLKYPVLEIGDNAFNLYVKQKIVVPESVQKIGDNAFYFPNANVIFLSKTPPTFGENVFYPSTSKNLIFVPSVSLEAYSSALSGYDNVEIKPFETIETFETLRADVDAIKAELSASIAEIDTLIGEGV